MEQLKKLQSLIEEELKLLPGGNPAELYDPIKYILSLGGKRIRPVLLLLACQEFGRPATEALKAALGIEVFHNFTLLHDDIMDKAPLRRSKPTVHEKWNADIAILSGDAMFVKSCQLICEVPDSIVRHVLNVFYKTAIEVCEGQQLDMNFENQNDVSIAQYERMITLKTAVLLGASLYIGSLIGGASQKDAELMYEFGKGVGVAFQLQDDILDVYGGEGFGKQVGGDIASNKKTFLLLKAFELAKDKEYNSLQFLVAENEGQVKAEEKVRAVKEIYNALNIRKLAEDEMDKHYRSALRALDATSLSPSGKAIFRKVADDLMVRVV